MISYLVVYPFCRLVFGTLYPAYASYKAVRTKNLKEYVKWMMYWIVFALFSCTETFTDVFLSWFPFYYEVKIVLVLWLLSPATKGSSILYRKFVHPALCRREQEIDEYIAKAKDQGYHTVLNLGTKGVNYATTVIMQTAIKGGGGLVQQLRKSYSLSDLSECETREERGSDEADDVLAEPRLIRRATKSGYSTRRSASESNSRSPMYFPEVDVDVRTARARTDEPDFSHIKSSEDISSGYSSADNSASLSRAASLGARRARPARAAVTPIKRPQAAEESEVIIEELYDDDTFEYSNMPPLVNLPSPIFLSQTDPPFIYQYVGDQIKIIQVLAKDLPNTNSNKDNSDRDIWDQKVAVVQEASQENSEKEEIESQSKEVFYESEADTHNEQINIIQKEISTEGTIQLNIDDSNDQTNNQIGQTSNSENEMDKVINSQMTDLDKVDDAQDLALAQKNVPKTDEHLDMTSLDTSVHENDSAESDDEASFGTPEDSPKSKRKSPKGKYGKAKAPPPPKLDIPKNVTEHDSTNLDSAVSTTSLESLNDLVSMLPNESFKETGAFKGGLQIVNPIAEKKRRHKSKSPGRIPKSQGSGISKLLQLPTKLAFWHKSEDKSKSDGISVSSDDLSRRSSTIEKQTEEYQSCLNLNVENTANDNNISLQADISDDQTSFKDACDMDSEVISHDIIEKSDALQKLIEAKIESHPEYKFVSLHDEIQTTSKSTDV
ncbi:hypothetical protein ABMA28_002619 [Loxostege sticticalis]|uniref:Receptor expression-enhancing protein n=1 Tax=Loxostege sticticalis TaxID=481309 RepID=A0ABD0SXH1_LOXSC